MVFDKPMSEGEKRIVKNTLEAARLRAQGMANIYKEILEEMRKIEKEAQDLEPDGR